MKSCVLLSTTESACLDYEVTSLDKRSQLDENLYRFADLNNSSQVRGMFSSHNWNEYISFTVTKTAFLKFMSTSGLCWLLNGNGWQKFALKPEKTSSIYFFHHSDINFALSDNTLFMFLQGKYWQKLMPLRYSFQFPFGG